MAQNEIKLNLNDDSTKQYVFKLDEQIYIKKLILREIVLFDTKLFTIFEIGLGLD